MSRFVGRKSELETLAKLTDKKSASFIVIKGRRRIGKSRLINEFSKRFDHYYSFTGLPPEKKTNAKDQLDEFCRQISRQFNAPSAKYEDWSDALWSLGERVQSGKLLWLVSRICG